MNIIGIVITAVVAFILLMTGVFFYFSRSKGSNKKYPFLLYSDDGSVVRTITGKVKIDKNNNSKKCFVFEDNDTKLPVKKPTVFINGKPHRQITIGERGEYVYLEKTKIDRSSYLSSALSSEDVAVATSLILENNREFDNPMQKTTAALVIGMAVIALLIMIGNVYVTITMVSNSDNLVASAKEISEGVKGLKDASMINAEVAETNAAIAAALTGELNITRRLE